MIDTETPKSPGWWLKRLSQQLNTRAYTSAWDGQAWERDSYRPPLQLLDSYLRGDPPLPTCAKGWQDGMRAFLRLSRMNYALLSVQAVQQRMVPLGFGTAVDSDRNGDQKAAEIYDANELDLRTAETFEHMLGLADGYMIAGPPDSETGIPTITTEDPREVITAHDPVTGRVVAALKVFDDQWDEMQYAYVYLPGRVFVASQSGRGSVAGAVSLSKGWEWVTAKGGADGQPLPAALKNRVPVVRFHNARGVGEFEPHLDVLDRINDGIFERVTIAKLQAFRQRAIEGAPNVYPPEHPQAGQEIDYSDTFVADPGSLWLMPPDAKIWESQPVPMDGIRMSIKDDVEAFAAVTMTPLHYINPEAAQGSAEGASVMKEGHLFRVEDRRRRADRALATVMSLAFAWMGDEERADATKIRTLWKPAERHSLEQRASSASQAKAGGLPQASIDTDIWGYAPSDLPRLESERARDLLFLPPAPRVTGA